MIFGEGMTTVSAWENFYVIVGSSAGALIGLQFVVITLIADLPMRDGTAQAGQAFATPTVVHFGAVLLLAGILSAPWNSVAPVAVLWGLMALIGLIYTAWSHAGCGCKLHISRSLRTGCFTLCCPSLPTWLWQRPLSRPNPIYPGRCLPWPHPPCCCSS
jgi:hypothetical protein